MPAKQREPTMQKFIAALVFAAFLISAGGFVVLAVWDVPVAETPVEKTLENSRFLEKNT